MMKKSHFIFSVFMLVLCITARSQTLELWGMTSAGGDFGAGTIFKTDANGDNHNIQELFIVENEGDNPYYSKLCEATNGLLYGMTRNGGQSGYGILYSYNSITDTYSKILDFDNENKGANPEGSLIQTSDGKLFGMTRNGGINGEGVLFEYDPATSIYSKKHDFNRTNGSNPTGSLLQASNGKLYGMTRGNEFFGGSALFEYDPATNTYVKKLDFDGTNNGSYPTGSLVEFVDGKLYGMTPTGGTSDKGVLFEYDPSTDIFIKKLNFDGTNNGSFPKGSLIVASNGKLYGLTQTGGSNNLGVLFDYDPNAEIYTKKIDFDGDNIGSNPQGSLLEANDGKLYGLTSQGGSLGFGVIFEFDQTTDIHRKIHDFDDINGRLPLGTLTQANDGKLYGATQGGGKPDLGVLFTFDLISESYSNKLDFGLAPLGRSPSGSLMEANSGLLYGMTRIGGEFGLGVLFSYDPAIGTYTKKIDFDGTNKGSGPEGFLIQADNGKLYGMTKFGGDDNGGVLFEYNPATNDYLKKIDFDYTTGGIPHGSLIQAGNGKIYGMTWIAGSGGEGILFEYDPTSNAYSEKVGFEGVNGSYPRFGSLIQASNGNLYGMTAEGGSLGKGVLFEYNPNNGTYVKKFDFDGTQNGYDPQGSLVEASNGKLYGMTRYGGSGKGVLFEYDLATNNYNKKLNFDGSNGQYPLGTLMEATNGKLYAMTPSGTSNFGVIFEYDIDANNIANKFEFNEINGRFPKYGKIIEIDNQTRTTTDIISFSFPEQTIPTAPDIANNLIEIEVDYGTDLTSLISTFSLSPGASATVNAIVQVSGATANNFTNPVTYTITAEDGITVKDWIISVSIRPLYTSTDFLTFTVPEQSGPAIIDLTNHSLTFIVLFDTGDITDLVSTFTLSPGATAKIGTSPQVSGITTNDFSNPIIYTITAEDGVTLQDWSVSVVPNTETNIISFLFIGTSPNNTIDSISHTITSVIESGISLSNLVTEFTLSYGASSTVNSIAQVSGVTSNNFTNPVTYRVKAEDDITTQDWIVSAVQPQSNIISYSFAEETGVSIIDPVNQTVDIQVVQNTDLTLLTPTFSLSSGANATINSMPQISGVTSNDFTNPVIYQITAEDGFESKQWSINVSVVRDTIFVPSDYVTIQEAFDAAVDGNLILVGPGEYYLNLNFSKNIELKSTNGAISTILRPSNSGVATIAFTTTLSNAIISGFTFSYGGNLTGSAIDFAAPHSGKYLIENCIMTNNDGYAVDFYYANPIFNNCVFYNNNANYFCNPNDFQPSFINSILMGPGINSPNPGNPPLVFINSYIEQEPIGLFEIHYSNIKGGWISNDGLELGVGNMDIDPKFVDAINGNFNILDSSPMIGAGISQLDVNGISYTAPSSDFNNNSRPNPIGSNPDIGIYESPLDVPSDFGVSNTIFPTIYNSGSNNEIASVTVVSKDAIQATTFNSKLITDGSFSGEFVSSSTDTYEYEISESQIADRGLEYFFLIESKSGEVISTDTTLIGIKYTYENAPLVPNLAKGGQPEHWRMFSIPYELDQNTIHYLIETQLGPYDIRKWRMVRYKNDSEKFVEYQSGLSTIERKNGYWLNSKEEAIIRMGSSTTPNVSESNLSNITLQQGWSQIGNPYTFDIKWSDVLNYNSATGIGGLRMFSGGTDLVDSDIMVAFGGAYVFADQITTLEIPLSASTGGRIKGEEFENSWNANLTVETGIYSNTISGFGMHPLASNSKDNYDGIRVPRFNNYIDITFEHPEYFASHFSKDIIPNHDNYVWQFEVESNIEEQTRTITWSFGNNSPEMDLYLVDLTNNNVVNMSNLSTYSYQSNVVRNFKVIYGDESYLNSQFNGENIGLGDAYPNPFESKTTIPYSLFGEGDEYLVNLVIYSVQGVKVKTLVNKSLKSGVYSIDWDAKDEFDLKVKGGIYIYSLEVIGKENQYSNRKKLIIR